MSDDHAGSADVTVIGCGFMGSALARQLAKSGYRVVAWNRTHERAEALADDGVIPVRSVTEAVRSSPFIVTCTSTYDTTFSSLGPIESFAGATVANMANGTPQEAEQFERWATERGAVCLEGGIFCYPQDIGAPGASIFYSGTTDLWSQHEEMLMTLGGGSRHVGEAIKLANVMFVGISAFFMPAASAYVEAASYLLEQGVSVDTLREITVPPIHTITYMADETVAAITRDQYETDQATISLYVETAQICLDAVQQAGYRARLLVAAVDGFKAAEAAGLGKLGYYAQSKVARSDFPS